MSTPDETPASTVRVATDVVIKQIAWWAEQLIVVPAPTWRGHWASVQIGWRALTAARSADAFISGNPRNALIIGLWKRLTGQTRPALMMVEMRLDDPRPGLAWRAKVALQRFAYAAVDAMCVSAKREALVYAERLAIPAGRFHFVPWHTNVLEPRMAPVTGNYAFAAGRTSRDWRTLAAAAEGVDVQITVVCSQEDAAAVRFPSNVTVLTDIPYDRYRSLLEGARLVLVPLEAHAYSSGQVVILEAMALGKPLITTRVLGTEDYVTDGVDGVLVPPGDVAALRAAIHDVATTPGRAEALGRTALEKVQRQHTLDQYVRTIFDLAVTKAARRA
ncbi:MAG: glycosyltransferase family 4 protein [Acidobacteria bacterium]|nr:glycosyltransferase family 4 protein [Acidobacteriota bacterium]